MTPDELAELQARNGLTNEALASVLGVSEQTVERYLSGERPVSGRSRARLSEFTVAGEGTAAAVEAPAVDGLGPDELPEPPHNPAAEEPPEPEPEKPARRRRSSSGSKQLAGWQEEAQQFLSMVIKGASFPVVLPDGNQQVFQVPGFVTWPVQTFWCPTCAAVIHNAADPWAAAFVKAYPGVAKRYLIMGGQAEFAVVTVQLIVMPCLLHHIHLGHAREAAPMNGGEGRPAPHPDYAEPPA